MKIYTSTKEKNQDAPLIFVLHFPQECASSRNRPIPFIFSLIPTHHVFLKCLLALVHFTFIIVQRLIESVLSLCSTSADHLNLPFLVTRLTGSNQNSSLNSAFFFFFKVNPHIYLTIHAQFSLSNLHVPSSSPGLADMYQITPHAWFIWFDWVLTKILSWLV